MICEISFISPIQYTVYPKAAKRYIPCATLLSLNDSMIMIAAAELLAYN